MRDLALATRTERPADPADRIRGQDPADDPEAPFELRPRMGRLPVERVQHGQLYFESLLEDLGNGDDIGRDAPPELYSLEGVGGTGPDGGTERPGIRRPIWACR